MILYFILLYMVYFYMIHELYMILFKILKNEYFCGFLCWIIKTPIILFLINFFEDHEIFIYFILSVQIIEGIFMLLILTPFTKFFKGKSK